MSEKDAKVRLELAAGGFLSMLKNIEKEAGALGKELEGVGESGAKAERKLHPALGSIKKGLGAAKDTLADLGKELKNTIGQAATLGGALSVAAGAKSGTELVAIYKDLAFAISTGTGQAIAWTDVQKDVEGAAKRWKRDVNELAGAYAALYDETGDVQFSADALDAIAIAANASGKSVNTLTAIAGTLNEKFGIAGNEMQDALASVIELSSKGGANIDDLGAKLGIVGASAKQMGLEGKAGLQQVLGMLNVGDNVTGSFKKNLTAVTGLMETFGNADKLKSIEKDLGVKITDKGGGARKDALDKILAKTGGKEETLSKVFQGDTLKLVSDFGKTYQKVFAETEGNAKKKTAAALDAFHKALEEAGKTSLTAAQLEAEAKKRAATDPDRVMADVMNRFKTAFTKPEMMASMEKLAQLLPRLTNGFTTLLEFAADHPILAGAAFVGKGAGMSALGSVAGDVAGLGKDKAVSLGKSIGANLAAEAARNGAWSTAGKNLGAAAGIAVAAAVAYELGKAAIDSVYEDKAKDQGDLASAGAGAAAAKASGDKGRMAKEADSLRARIDAAKKNREGVGGFMDDTFGAAAHLFSGGEVKGDVQANVLAKAEAELRELEVAMSKGAKGGDKVAQAHDRAAQAAERLAKAMDKVKPPGGGGGGNNGLPPAPGNQSGSTPK
jgi:hypothetical protein